MSFYFSLMIKQRLIDVYLIFGLLVFVANNQVFPQPLFPSQEVVDKTWELTSLNNNCVLVPYIQSVQFYLSGNPMTYPNLAINGKSLLELHFDDIDSMQHNFYYTIEQYDAKWIIRNNDVNSYLEGFANNDLHDYELSAATSIPYRHYVLHLPNNDIKIKRTGNYLLKVFDHSTDSLVIARRFTVYDNQIPIEANLRMTHGGSMKYNGHELYISIDISRIQVVDVFTDIQVVIVPNYIWHKAVTDITPKFIRGDIISYEKIVSPNNEFRTLNLKELNTNYSDIQKLFTSNGIVHLQLPTDIFRNNNPPRSSDDMNGLNYIEKFGSWNSNTQADYFYAYFTLKSELPMLEGNVYIYGSLSGYSFNPWNLMIYDMDKGLYENRMLLKQGFHDYCYAFVTSYDNSIDFSRIEGDFAQTSNDYHILVYNRDRYTGLYNLSGFTVVTSFP